MSVRPCLQNSESSKVVDWWFVTLTEGTTESTWRGSATEPPQQNIEANEERMVRTFII